MSFKLSGLYKNQTSGSIKNRRHVFVVICFMTLCAKFQVIGSANGVHKDSLVPTNHPESCFEKSGFYKKEAKNYRIRAARIVTNSSFDAVSRPFVGSLGWQTVRERIYQDSQSMVYDSIYVLAPRCMSNLFARNPAGSSCSLLNTKTDLRFPRKHPQMGRIVFRIEVQYCGTAS